MALKKVYLGSVGPFVYDDANPVNDPDGDFPGEDHKAITTNGQILVDQAPAADEEVLRLVDLGGGTAGFIIPTELTINGGVITIAGAVNWRFHSIDTEGDVASDELDTINGGNAGEILLLQAENDARTVICKEGASLKLQFDFSLNNVEDKLMLMCISSGVWHEISRASNGS